MNRIRNLVEDRQSRFACQTVSGARGKKSTSWAKLKAANQEERLQKWKEHFKNLLGNPPEITNIHTKEIIYGQLDIKLRQFTERDLTH